MCRKKEQSTSNPRENFQWPNVSEAGAWENRKGWEVGKVFREVMAPHISQVLWKLSACGPEELHEPQGQET